MTDPILPSDRASEEAVIGSVFINPDCFTDLQFLAADDFYIVKHQWIWNVMSELRAEGSPLDILMISTRLHSKGWLIELGGDAYLTQLLASASTSANAEAYAKNVKNMATRRKLLLSANVIANLAVNNAEGIDTIVAGAEKEIRKAVSDHSGKADEHTVCAEMAGLMAMEMTQSASQGERDFQTGINELDEVLYPQRGELIIVAGTTGKGKSAALNTFALNAARKQKRIKLFTLEMSIPQTAQRFLSQISGVDSFRIMKGTLTPEEWDMLQKAQEEFAQLHIEICDLPAIKIGQIKTEARRGNLDCVMVDYIQLAEADKPRENRTLDVGEISRGLKGLAKELDIPIFAAAQLSRAVDQRSDKRPQLSDLRESGSLEQDSDSVLFIYQDPIKLDNYELITAKHRNGPVGSIYVNFNAPTTRFSGMHEAFTLKERADVGD